MTTNPKSSRRLSLAALVVSLALAGCAGITTAPSPALLQQIESARTPADHSALETYYTKEAAMARTKAAEHRRMGKSYQTALAMGRGGGSWQAHCNANASSYEEIASRYDAMAGEHRQMAAQAKP